MEVFYLQHVHTFENGAENVKTIGIYSSHEKAQQAIQRLSDQPGFKKAPEGFVIDHYDVDSDHWEEGYVTVTYEPHSFPALIAQLADGCALADVQPRFAELFLEFGSETPDNLNCVQHVGIGEYIEPHTNQQRIGLLLTRLGIPVSRIMNHIENLALPASIQHAFPDLTESEWDAATRALTMVSLACD